MSIVGGKFHEEVVEPIEGGVAGDDGEDVDVETGVCSCPDAEHNLDLDTGEQCKHAYRGRWSSGSTVSPSGLNSTPSMTDSTGVLVSTNKVRRPGVTLRPTIQSELCPFTGCNRVSFLTSEKVQPISPPQDPNRHLHSRQHRPARTRSPTREHQ